MLVENQVVEGKNIDYKATLPGGKDDDKKEFLADICALANTAGGDLIYGIREGKDSEGRNNGMPEAIPGLKALNFDAERLRLLNIIRDGIAPAVVGVDLQQVDGFDEGPVLVVRVPRSWMAPHMVTFRGTSRFYARHAAGKFQLDVDAIRAAFLSAATIPERLQRIRTERTGRILAGETPVPMAGASKYILHVVSFASLAGGESLAESMSDDGLMGVGPIAGSGWNHRLNFDGLLNYRGPDGDRAGYVQFFRSGLVEFVTDDLVLPGRDRRLLAPVEHAVIEALRRVLPALQACGQSFPMFVALTLSGVQGAQIPVSAYEHTFPFDRDVLILPEMRIDSMQPTDQGVASAMRPAFDIFWQAAGCARSPNYDSAGNWSLRR